MGRVVPGTALPFPWPNTWRLPCRLPGFWRLGLDQSLFSNSMALRAFFPDLAVRRSVANQAAEFCAIPFERSESIKLPRCCLLGTVNPVCRRAGYQLGPRSVIWLKQQFDRPCAPSPVSRNRRDRLADVRRINNTSPLGNHEPPAGHGPKRGSAVGWRAVDSLTAYGLASLAHHRGRTVIARTQRPTATAAAFVY